MKDSGYPITDQVRSDLFETAMAARRFSYSPYSGFAVGAALLGEDGVTYTGCNIENAAYTPTNCAERTAFFKAVSQGCSRFRAIAVVGGPAGADDFSLCAPCGVCRQVMAEFCTGDFEIILAGSDGALKIYTLAELLPERFGPDNLGR